VCGLPSLKLSPAKVLYGEQVSASRRAGLCLLPLRKRIALKVSCLCHSERSEESVLSSSENGFFVTSFLSNCLKNYLMEAKTGWQEAKVYDV